MSKSDYDINLEVLKTAREEVQRYKDEMTAMLKSVTESPNYAATRQAADEATDRASQIEEAIRATAVEHYTQTGDKNPHPKVTVKIFKVFSVTDPARVLAWVKQNLADALVVDEKKVKSYATKIGAVEGTTLTDEARAQIATEL
jgi:hypothetical protein